MKINQILKQVYKLDKESLKSYFQELDFINIVYCKELYKKNYFSKKEIDKILKASLFLKSSKYRVLLKTSYKRGYYFEYENFLKKRIGQNISGKIHIGRSRNDLEATISKLILKKKIYAILQKQLSLLYDINKKFSSDTTLFPFYTQNQFASFLTPKHYFNSNILSFVEYQKKILNDQNFINECPLGACGLSGSSINIDYKSISKKLNFKTLQLNSHRSVSEYEYQLSLVNDLNLFVLKWTRILQDFQLLHNENNKIIKFEKKFYGKSSFFPHKKNIFLIEYALSISNKLCNYGSLIINSIKKSINSNSFEVKSTLKSINTYFNEYFEFINLISYIIQNLSFNKIDIFHEKYESLFYTYLQNYLIKTKKNLNFRNLNSKIFNQIDKNQSFQKILSENRNNLPGFFWEKNINDIKKILISENKYGMGPQDPKVHNSTKIKKILKQLEKEIKKIN